MTPPQQPPRRLPLIKIAAALLLSFGLLFAAYQVWHRSPLDLGESGVAEASELYARWKAGDVVVLVRHGERCDQSDNACFGPEDGITRLGRDVAAQVGSAFAAMGLSNTDVLNSPLTRTTQTSQAMFGQVSKAQDWLVNCDDDMSQDIKAHKARGRNMVLVTHSGCISDFNAVLGFPNALTAEYSSALFTTLDRDGQLQVLGVVNAEDWARLLAKR